MHVLKNVAFYATVFFMLLTPNVNAHEHKQEKGKVTIENAWARSTFALAKTGAVYLSINNQSQLGN